MDHPFDIEQDNNPSLYESSAPNSSQPHNPQTPDIDTGPDSGVVVNKSSDHQSLTDISNDDYFNNSITLSNTIRTLLDTDKLSIDIEKTEKLINSSVVVYLIDLVNVDTNEKITVKRRYSEFKSFRDCLNKLFPTAIIPPIPEKHSFMQFFFNSLNADNELQLVDFRTRFFHKFLVDLLKVPVFKSNVLVQKFLDPNYELCWHNALNEPPVNNIPKNLLLANPINPMDQNGLYLLLPKISNFQNSHISELYKLNLDSLGHLNDQILKLNSQMVHLKLPANKFSGIPPELIMFETYIIHNLRILRKMNKFSVGHIKNFKSLLMSMINLGGNLNNFSLEIYELNVTLSTLIEKFGSIIDLNYLNYENFLINNFMPNFYEIINQLIHYFNIGSNLINFYKFKIYQFKILFKTKFSYLHQLANLNIHNGSLSNLSELNLNSPSINNLIRSNRLQKKKSWYQIFGGKTNPGTSSPIKTPTRTPPTSSPTPTLEPLYSLEDTNHDLQRKIENLERELSKLDQLIDLLNNDLVALTNEIMTNFQEFCKLIERKWLFIFLSFIRSTKQLFTENLNNWTDFKLVFNEVN